MQRLSSLLRPSRDEDFSEGDHREYVESGSGDILLIGGAVLLLVGGFIASLA
jgi:hypothetical protein